MKCPECGEENQPRAKFCRSCGSALEVVCPECGAKLEVDAKYCIECGAASPLYASAEETKGRSTERVGPNDSQPQQIAELSTSVASSAHGERKLVTILFSDIVDSTPMAGRLDPEEWKEIVGGAHQRVSQAVLAYGGTIAQLLGDGVLAFFGAPVTHEDDAIRAVQAALDLQRSIAGYQAELAGLVDNFAMRVGIHTGHVVVGEIGGDSHREYLALGGPVNIASRLQGQAGAGGVLISEATAGLVEGTFELESLGPLSLKGLEEPVTVFQVKGVKRAPESSRGLPGLKTPLVGRQEPLGQLEAALTALRRGRGQVAVVTGEAGIGKTRLVEEARTRTMVEPPDDGTEPGIHWLEGRALSYGESLSFWAINQLLLNDLGLSEGESPVRVGVALRRRVRRLFGDEAPNVTPYLLHLMGAPLKGEWAELIRQLDGETRKHQTILALAAYLEKTAKRSPTVVLLEDAHWLDPSSLAAIEELLPLTDRVPLMVLLLMRVEREHGSWQLKMKMEDEFHHRWTEAHLEPLGADEAGRLASSLLATQAVDQRLQAVLLERASGNPFYLEELVRDLMERGLIVRGPDSLRVAEEDLKHSIPGTLQGVLAGRIDRLPEQDRRVLQLASVIGESFLLRILEAVSQDDLNSVAASLGRLMRAEFLRETTSLPEREYTFRHSLTQEAAYQSLLVEHRKDVHQRVGEALESFFQDRREEVLGLLAHHFERAGDAEKAVAYLLEAGDRARLREELPEAADYYHRALTLLSEAEDWDRAAQTWLKLGLVHLAGFDFEAVHEANETAFNLAERRSQSTKKPTGAAGDDPEKAADAALRVAVERDLATLDPAKNDSVFEEQIIQQIFVGLTELDSQANVVPNLARSWEVMDEGRRYVFHLRDDARWTDGNPVTAQDFEWALKRNLAPGTQPALAHLLDPIEGARAFRQGLNSDADSVGVCALDDQTLEIRLAAPTGYFLYLTTIPNTFPLPAWCVEKDEDEWWKPNTIVSNGPYRLENLTAGTVRLVRNQGYFGRFPGNVSTLELHKFEKESDRVRGYLDGTTDITEILDRTLVPQDVSNREGVNVDQFSIGTIVVNPGKPPLDSILVRKALAHALDREAVRDALGWPKIAMAHGGIIPPGMAGHSPGLALDFDPEAARQLLEQAGYSGDARVPPILVARGHFGSEDPVVIKLARKWREILGLDIRLTDQPAQLSFSGSRLDFQIAGTGWTADFPDPYNFLRQSEIWEMLKAWGWKNPKFEDIVAKASASSNRSERSALYRQADSILVDQEVLVIPVHYSMGGGYLIKPWVRNYRRNALGLVSMKDVVISRLPNGGDASKSSVGNPG